MIFLEDTAEEVAKEEKVEVLKKIEDEEEDEIEELEEEDEIAEEMVKGAVAISAWRPQWFTKSKASKA